MTSSFNHIISEIQRKENAISLSTPNIIDEAYQMTVYLKEYLWSIREDVIKQGFKNQWEEINFFRNVKPYILSKLIYHNKVFRIQTACPVDGGKMYASYFAEQLQELKRETGNTSIIRTFTDIIALEEPIVMKLTLGWATSISTTA